MVQASPTGCFLVLSSLKLSVNNVLNNRNKRAFNFVVKRGFSRFKISKERQQQRERAGAAAAAPLHLRTLLYLSYPKCTAVPVYEVREGGARQHVSDRKCTAVQVYEAREGTNKVITIHKFLTDQKIKYYRLKK